MLRAEAPTAPPSSQALRAAQLRVDGRDRSYVLYVPERLRPEASLLVMLHGSRQSADDLRRVTGYAFERLADEHGFAVVYPEAFRKRWNDCRAAGSYPARAENVDDVRFVMALVDAVAAQVDVDRSRVFFAGYSSGAQLAFRAALERPERLAGIAAFSANLPTPENWLEACANKSSPVPVLLVNGTRDRINPFSGGRVTVFGFASRGTVRSAFESAEFFAALGSEHRPRGRYDGTGEDSWEEWRWSAPGSGEVVLLAVRGGGHVVPGPRSAFPAILGRVSRGLDGPSEAWRFFARQPSSATRDVQAPEARVSVVRGQP